MINFIVTTAKKGKGKRLYVETRHGNTIPYRYLWTKDTAKALRFKHFEEAQDYAEKAYKAHVMLEDEGGLLYAVCNVPLNPDEK